jgi:hypothetical protein
MSEEFPSLGAAVSGSKNANSKNTKKVKGKFKNAKLVASLVGGSAGAGSAKLKSDQPKPSSRGGAPMGLDWGAKLNPTYEEQVTPPCCVPFC